MVRSKRYKEEKQKIENKEYSIEEAVKFIKDNSKAKFDQSVELHINLGIEPTQADQIVRGSVVLPHGTGKAVRIVAFVPAAKEKEARQAGADLIGDEALIKEIKEKQKIDFDLAVATPDMMRNLAPIAKILGQKGLMPNPKTETVGPNIVQIITGLKKGKTTFRNDDSGNIHQMIGKISSEPEKLVENARIFIEAIKKSKPQSSKGVFMKNISLKSTMGPSVRVKF